MVEPRKGFKLGAAVGHWTRHGSGAATWRLDDADTDGITNSNGEM